MQTNYLEAVVNRRHRVLGRRLHDFCLYDALFLELAGNPIWLSGRAPLIGDLIEAVLICALPPERFLRAELAPRTWLERLTRAVWQIAVARRHDDPGFLDRELSRFRVYVADFYALPKTWDAKPGGHRIRAPWILSVANFIEMHSNMTEREIMTAPIGLMHWRAETIAERLGQSVCDLMTQDEIEIGEEQQQALAEAGEEFPDEAADDELDMTPLENP